MATAAELVMAPSAARPETASARKDAPAAGETSFAEVLDNEVQAANDTETSDNTNAAAATQTVAQAQAQPTPPQVAASAVEVLISLQSGDATAAQPVADAGEATTVAPAAASAVAAVVTPEAVTAGPAPAVPAQATVQQPAQRAAVPQASVEAVPAAAAAAVAVVAPKAVQAVADDAQEEASAEGEPVVAPLTDVEASADPAAAAGTPVENAAAAAQTTAAPAQAVVVAAAMPAPKPVASSAPQPEEKPASKVQPTANREAPVAGAQAADTQDAAPKSDAPVPNAASASQTTGSVKPQTGVQPAAADATPDIKTDVPAPTSPSTSTSFADLLAAGRGATDVAKVAPAHPAMQSAPQAAVQVYTRFVERFDGRAQRFEVRLDPAELGRVDVKIEIGADKKVHAVLAAHDSAALTDLMRGQRALERALTDAGIDLKDGGLKFELANDSNRGLAGQDQRRDGWTGEEANPWRGFSAVDVAVETDAPVATASYRRTSRLDLVA